MTDALNPTLMTMTVAAAQALMAYATQLTGSRGYVARRSRPGLKTDENGWPSRDDTSVPGDPRLDCHRWFMPRADRPSSSWPDVPELQELISFVRAEETLVRRFTPIVGHVKADEQLERLESSDVLHFVSKIINRAVATGRNSESDIEEIYRLLERGLLAEELEVDLIFPLACARFDTDAPFEIAPDIFIERMDPSMQMARLADLTTAGDVSPPLIAAATHAVVLRNRVLDNPGGPFLRQVRIALEEPIFPEVDRACQALQIASTHAIGYAQICARTVGWADSWVDDLPNVTALRQVRRYPVFLDRRGWVHSAVSVTTTELEELPEAYDALAGKTHKKVALAARRLTQTSFRDNDDDILLDACIGMEALLGEGRDELTHRMALRAATALAHIPIGARGAYDALKHIYTQRSIIVHGGTPKSNVMRLATHDGDLPVSEVARQLLVALLRAHIQASPRWTPRDLDAQLLDSLDARPPS